MLVFVQAYEAAMRAGVVNEGSEFAGALVRDFPALAADFMQEALDCAFATKHSLRLSLAIHDTCVDRWGVWKGDVTAGAAVQFLRLIGLLGQRYSVARQVFLERLRKAVCVDGEEVVEEEAAGDDVAFDYMKDEERRQLEEGERAQSMKHCHLPASREPQANSG